MDGIIMSQDGKKLTLLNYILKNLTYQNGMEKYFNKKRSY